MFSTWVWLKLQYYAYTKIYILPNRFFGGLKNQGSTAGSFKRLKSDTENDLQNYEAQRLGFILL